ncbi:MAG: hypothetical protein AAF654_09700 [Myxococcota bacterium]
MKSFLDADVALFDQDHQALVSLSAEGFGAHISRVTSVVPSPMRSVAPPRASWMLGFGGAGVAFAAALAVFVIVRSDPGEGIRTKGGGEVRLYYTGGGEPVLWDGLSPFSAGTRIQIEVAGIGEGVHTVAVDARGGQGWEPIHRSEIEGPRALVPQGWAIDGARPVEELCVRVTRAGEPLPPAPREDCDYLHLELSVR